MKIDILVKSTAVILAGGFVSKYVYEKFKKTKEETISDKECMHYEEDVFDEE